MKTVILALSTLAIGGITPCSSATETKPEALERPTAGPSGTTAFRFSAIEQAGRPAGWWGSTPF